MSSYFGRAYEPTARCCDSSAPCSSRAFILQTSPKTTAAAPSNPLSSETTIFVSSSARPRDDESGIYSNAQRIVDAVRTTRSVLSLEHSRACVVFDGLGGKPGVTDGMRSRYAVKIKQVHQLLQEDAAVDLLVSEEWLHMANSLRCAFRSEPRTRFVFVLQDDTQMAGPVDMRVLTPFLRSDPKVEYVKFYMYRDCVDGKTRKMIMGAVPCVQHPSTRLLHSTLHWQDRPHFATRDHYERHLFSRLPMEAKATPEQFLDQYVRNAKNWSEWGLWTYGQRGDMLRELHAAVHVDGKLVTREFLTAAQANASGARYAHSYLIHAYRSGGSQDVRLKQIHERAFRAHNPFWMMKEDGVRMEA